MAREGLSPTRFAVVLVFLAATACADDRIANTLAVQNALQQGRAHLLKGDHQAAVHALESQITRIDGNSQYLAVLRDAYRGLVKSLKLAGRDEDAAVYARRLQILDPGAALDFAKPPEAPKVPEVKPAPKPVKEPVVRSQGDDPPRSLVPPTPDPFNQGNATKSRDAQAHLEQAEKLFRAANYSEAAALYHKANEAAPELVLDSRERWAYCKLFAVNERLNDKATPIDDKDWPALETQVRTAMAMTPKMEKFAATLLTTLRERRTRTAEVPAAPEVSVNVRHTNAGSGWQLAETTNFRIYHRLDEGKATEVAKIVETTRAAMQKKWFGKVEETWEPRCDVYLYPDADSYARATGVRASAPGHARVDRAESSERIIKRQLHMNLQGNNVLATVLPHETTHVVLAGRFGPVDVPRWADEGIAVLTEPREQIDRHLRNLPTHRQERTLFNVQGLMELQDYPHPRQIGAFYAQSVSLVEYLSTLKGPETFAKFLTEGLRGGYEPALRKYYGLQSYAELETGWASHAFKDAAAGVAQRGE